MRARIFRLGTALIIAVMGLALFGTLASLAAPSARSTGKTEITAKNVPDIQMRRAISIPFGIADVLAVSADGRHITVAGHGTCQEGGDWFSLNLTIDQESTGAKAKAYTEETCTGDSQEWEVTAEALGPVWRTFEAGEAQACATAIVHRGQGGAVVNQWCKIVELE